MVIKSNGNIWASTHNSSGGYSIIKFPYSAGKTIDGKSQTPIVSFDDMVRVNYDATKDYIGYTEAYSYNVVAASNPTKILYSIDLSTKGYDPTNQTWQSQSLLFPYFYRQTPKMSAMKLLSKSKILFSVCSRKSIIYLPAELKALANILYSFLNIQCGIYGTAKR